MKKYDVSTGEVIVTGIKFTLLNLPFWVTAFEVRAHFKIMKLSEKTPLKFLKFPRSISKFKGSTVSKVGLNAEESECVDEFLEVIRGLPYVNEALFFNNMHPNAIKKAKYKFIFQTKLGEYIPDKREILYYGECRETIFHELLHMASSRECGDYFCCGFEETKCDEKGEPIYTIGTGLMEGYTQLLTLRYFAKKGAYLKSYPLLVRIASYIEVLIGFEKMEAMYFRSDLEGLASLLEQYIPRNLIISLLKDIDYIYAAIHNERKIFTRALAVGAYQRVLKIIALLLKKKIVKERIDKDPQVEAVFYSLKNYKMNVGIEYEATKNTREIIDELRRRASRENGANSCKTA